MRSLAYGQWIVNQSGMRMGADGDAVMDRLNRNHRTSDEALDAGSGHRCLPEPRAAVHLELFPDGALIATFPGLMRLQGDRPCFDDLSPRRSAAGLRHPR